jgi:hypothetical protein
MALQGRRAAEKTRKKKAANKQRITIPILSNLEQPSPSAMHSERKRMGCSAGFPTPPAETLSGAGESSVAPAHLHPIFLTGGVT